MKVQWLVTWCDTLVGKVSFSCYTKGKHCKSEEPYQRPYCPVEAYARWRKENCSKVRKSGLRFFRFFFKRLVVWGYCFMKYWLNLMCCIVGNMLYCWCVEFDVLFCFTLTSPKSYLVSWSLMWKISTFL